MTLGGETVVEALSRTLSRTRGLLFLGRGVNCPIALEIPECPELWSPLLAVIPLLLLAYPVALRAGRDVDLPRTLAKSVTVE